MSEMTAKDYEALAARLTDPAVPLPKPANVRTGDAAAAAGREFLRGEYGSEEALEAVLRSAGRPRLGERAKGPSPSVRGRIPEADRAAFDRLMELSGKKESELVRVAIHRLLVDEKMLAS